MLLELLQEVDVILSREFSLEFHKDWQKNLEKSLSLQNYLGCFGKNPYLYMLCFPLPIQLIMNLLFLWCRIAHGIIFESGEKLV